MKRKTKTEWEEHETYQTALASFRTWWEPHSHDDRSGAAIGGQPDAWRWWSKPTENGFARAQYGEIAHRAFKSSIYYGQWREWLQAGEPYGQWVEWADGEQIKHSEPFISICVTQEKYIEETHKLAEMARELVRKMKIGERV